MCLNLYDCQAKESIYRNRNKLENRATTNKKQTTHSQKQKRRGYKNKIKGNHPTTTTRKMKGTKEKHIINWKIKFKMAINTYVSIIILTINGLNAPIKRHRMGGRIKMVEE